MPSPQPGTYILIIALAQSYCIQVGGLGWLTFEAGYYLYVGSALGGLEARLARHLRHAKRLHWHIDYLLLYGEIVEIWFYRGPERYECAWARALPALSDVHPTPFPFGASDCACSTHLFYSPARPTFAAFQALLGKQPVLFKQFNS